MKNAKKTLSLVMIAVFTTFIVLSGIPTSAATKKTTKAAKAKVTAAAKAKAAAAKAKAKKVAAAKVKAKQVAAQKAAAKKLADAKKAQAVAEARAAAAEKAAKDAQTAADQAKADQAAKDAAAAAEKAKADAAKAVVDQATAAVVNAEAKTNTDTYDLVGNADDLAAAQEAVTSALEAVTKLDKDSADYLGLMARIDSANAAIEKANNDIDTAKQQKDAEAAEATAVTAAEAAVAAVEAAPLATADDLTAALALGQKAQDAVAAVTEATKAADFTSRLKAVADKGAALKVELDKAAAAAQEAADEAAAPATIVSVSAVDGTITVNFDKKPVTDLDVADFTITKSIDGAASVAVTPTDVAAVDDTTATVTVPAVDPVATTPQSVVYSVTYVTGDAIDADAYSVLALPNTITGLTAVVASQQALVGTDTVVSFKAVDASGAPVVNGDVTFNVTQNTTTATTVLNPTYVATAKTDASGIASIKVNRVNPIDDTVTAYSTAAPTVRATTYVYNGVTSRLKVTSLDLNTVNNGSYKTYSVALRDANGNAMTGQKVYVTFAENLNGVYGTTASLSQGAFAGTTGTTTPYQTPTGQNQTFYVTTDGSGNANFVVIGTNTTVTPIAYWTASQVATDTYSESSLHATLDKVAFVGGQSNFHVTFTESSPVTSVFGATNGHKYTVKVTDANGAPYVNGTATVALSENIDNNIATNTDAYITSDQTAVLVPAAPVAGSITGASLALDSTGTATFYVQDVKQTTGLYPTATPVVWIDQNNVSNVQGRLETTEPYANGPTVTFRNEIVNGVQLNVNNALTAGNFVAANDTAKLSIQVNNQDGNATGLSTVAQVAWKIVNNSNASINVVSNGTTTPVAALNTTNVLAGTNPNLDVTTSDANSSVIVSAVVTLANSSSYQVAATTLNFTSAVAATTPLVGTIVGYDLHDATVAGLTSQVGCGRLLIKLDGTGAIVYANYGADQKFFIGTAEVATSSAIYNQLLTTPVTAFEGYVTVNDRVLINANGVYLQNSDNSSGQGTQGTNTATLAGGVIVPPTPGTTSITGVFTNFLGTNYVTVPMPAGKTIASIAVDGTTVAAANYNTTATAGSLTLTDVTATNKIVVTMTDGTLYQVVK